MDNLETMADTIDSIIGDKGFDEVCASARGSTYDYDIEVEYVIFSDMMESTIEVAEYLFAQMEAHKMNHKQFVEMLKCQHAAIQVAEELLRDTKQDK